MTTKIGKVLAIFISVAGIAFLGFAAVTAVGGPNWQTQMEDPDLHDYVFEASDGRPTQWSAKRLFKNETVSSPTIAPKVIVAVRSDLNTKQQQQIQEAEKTRADVEAKLAQAKEYIAADEKAVEFRMSELQKELDDLNKKIQAASVAVQQKAQQVQAKQAEAARREEDVLMYQTQLQELLTDRYRVVEQQKVLRDRLVRIRGSNDQLERRNTQLKQATAKP